MRQVHSINININNKQLLSLIYDKIFSTIIRSESPISNCWHVRENIPSVKFNTICLCDECSSVIGENLFNVTKTSRSVKVLDKFQMFSLKKNVSQL